MFGWLINIIVGIALQIIGYLLMPKTPQEKSEVQEMEDPVASAGIPVPVVFGTVLVEELNVLYFGDKNIVTIEVSGGKK